MTIYITLACMIALLKLEHRQGFNHADRSPTILPDLTAVTRLAKLKSETASKTPSSRQQERGSKNVICMQVAHISALSGACGSCVAGPYWHVCCCLGLLAGGTTARALQHKNIFLQNRGVKAHELYILCCGASCDCASWRSRGARWRWSGRAPSNWRMGGGAWRCACGILS